MRWIYPVLTPHLEQRDEHLNMHVPPLQLAGSVKVWIAPTGSSR
jgi:hypothetical protein